MLILKIYQLLLSAFFCLHLNFYTNAYQVRENYPNKLWDLTTTPKEILWQPRQYNPYPLSTPVIVEPNLEALVQSSAGFRSVIEHGTLEKPFLQQQQQQPPLQQYHGVIPVQKSLQTARKKLPFVNVKTNPKRSQEPVEKPAEDYANKYNKFVHTYFTTSLDKSAEKSTPNVTKETKNQNTKDVEPRQYEENSEAAENSDDYTYEDSSEVKDEESAHNSKKTKKLPKRQVKRHCKRIFKNGQDCIICKNSRNGEKSEVCSYSTEFKPQRYAYENVNSYRTVKDANNDYDYGNDADNTNGNNDEAAKKDVEYDEVEEESGGGDDEKDAYQQYDSNESTNAEGTDATQEDKDEEDAEGYDESGEKESEEYSGEYSEESASETKPIEVSQKKSKKNKLASATHPLEESKCIRKATPQKKVCYFCTTLEGGKMAYCYGAESYQEETKDLGKGRKKKKQRIFKRTISYSYEKDTGGMGDRVKRAEKQQNYFELLI